MRTTPVWKFKVKERRDRTESTNWLEAVSIRKRIFTKKRRRLTTKMEESESHGFRKIFWIAYKKMRIEGNLWSSIYKNGKTKNPFFRKDFEKYIWWVI